MVTGMGLPASPTRIALFIVAVGLLFRGVACSVPRVNVDEGWAYYVANNPVDQVLRILVKDRHPPLHYLALRSWHGVVGAREIPLRLPGALVAAFGVWLAFLVGREIAGYRAGLGAAGLHAVSFLAWEYETWLRNYHLLTALGLLSTLLFIRILRGGGLRVQAGYVLASALLLYSHYFGVLVLGAHVFQAAWSGWRAREGEGGGDAPPWKALAGCWLAIGLLFLPWVPSLHEQLTRRAARDLSAGSAPLLAVQLAVHMLPMLSGLEHIPDLLGLRDPAPVRLVLALDIAWTLLLGAACVNGLRRPAATPFRPLLMALLAPLILLVIAVGVKFPEMCRPRYYACFVPYVGMLLAEGAPREGTGRKGWVALCLIVVGVNLAVLADYARSPYFRSADWHTPARWVAARSRSLQAIAFHDNHVAHAFNFYYAGDRVRYDIRDRERPTLEFTTEYAASGLLPELRLWAEEFPEPAASNLRSLDRLALVLWFDANPGVRTWFSRNFGLVDALVIPNYSRDGRAEIYEIRRIR